MDNILLILLVVCCIHGTSRAFSMFSIENAKLTDARNVSTATNTGMSDSKIIEAINNLQSKVNYLEASNIILRKENQKLYEEMNHLKYENKKLSNQRLYSLEDEMSRLKNENKKLSNQVLEMVDELNNLKNQFKSNTTSIQTRQNTYVAFTAYATETRNYNSGTRVEFDGVLTNYGDHFNAFTSVFTCPTKAFYLFSIYIHTRTTSIWADMRLNGSTLVSIDSSHEFDSASNSAIVLCEEGQQVDVVCTSDGDQMFGSTSQMRSTFSGTLLQLVIE